MSHQASNYITAIARHSVLDQAYAWLRRQRLDTPANRSFWALSRRWPQIRQQLRCQLQAGDYQFSPVQQIQLHHGEWVSRWQPKDVIVLKTTSLVLTPLLRKRMNLTAATHSHNQLHQRLCDAIPDRRVQRLLWQVMNRVHMTLGNHRLIENKSIPRGSSISPLLGAIYLLPLDDMARHYQLDYVRYMDNIVIFSQMRHQLQRIIKRVYARLDELGLTLARDKTWVGRVSKGFDFLGYRISPAGLSMAKRSWDRRKFDFTGFMSKVRLKRAWCRLYKTGSDGRKLECLYM